MKKSNEIQKNKKLNHSKFQNEKLKSCLSVSVSQKMENVVLTKWPGGVFKWQLKMKKCSPPRLRFTLSLLPSDA